MGFVARHQKKKDAGQIGLFLFVLGNGPKKSNLEKKKRKQIWTACQKMKDSSTHHYEAGKVSTC